MLFQSKIWEVTCANLQKAEQGAVIKSHKSEVSRSSGIQFYLPTSTHTEYTWRYTHIHRYTCNIYFWNVFWNNGLTTYLCLCMCITCVYQAVLCSSLSPSEDLVRHLEILKGGISYKKVFPMLKIGNNPMMQGVRSLYGSTKGHLETGQLKAGIINWAGTVVMPARIIISVIIHV